MAAGPPPPSPVDPLELPHPHPHLRTSCAWPDPPPAALPRPPQRFLPGAPFPGPAPGRSRHGPQDGPKRPRHPHRALKDAMRWGYAARNVADSVEPPKGLPAERQVWTPEQLRAFLSHVRDDRLYAAWLLVATTGLRRAELAGLRW